MPGRSQPRIANETELKLGTNRDNFLVTHVLVRQKAALDSRRYDQVRVSVREWVRIVSEFRDT